MRKSLRRNEALTAEQARFFLDYDPQSGSLLWKNPTHTRIEMGTAAGSKHKNGRIYVSINGTLIQAHRLIWLIVHGRWPEQNLRAKDGDYTNLRLDNFVEESASETSQRAVRRKNTAGIRGVHPHPGGWTAHIRKNGQRKYLGLFKTKNEAAAVYAKARAEWAPPAAAPKITPEKQAEYAATRRRKFLLEGLWSRTLQRDQTPLAWATFEEFSAELGDKVFPHCKLVALDPEKPIGPGNYVLGTRAGVDRSTPEGRSAYQKRNYRQNRARYQEHHLRATFGIDLEQYNKMLKAQGGVCAICKEPETAVRLGQPLPLSVDHCHATGAIRGLLCRDCNHALGKFKDNPKRFRAAADYIEHHAAKSTSVPASNVIPLKERKTQNGNRSS